MASPNPGLFAGVVASISEACKPADDLINRGKDNDEQCEVVEMFVCMEDVAPRRPIRPTKWLVLRTETAKEARLRWQHASVARSFHGAVYGGIKNHQHVTAYDVAIGGGTATTHPLFCAYLCAVADWRLKDPALKEYLRPGILGWPDFQKMFAIYWKDEPSWRRDLIQGNVKYYTSGMLPSSLPLPPNGLPSAVVLQSFREGSIEFKEGKR